MIICIQHASLYLSRVKVLGWRSSKQNHLRMFSFHCIQSKYLSNFTRGCMPYKGGVSCEHERKLLVKYFVCKESRWRKDEVSPPAWLNLSGWLSCAPRYQLWYNGESNLVFVTFGQDPDWGGEERRWWPKMKSLETSHTHVLWRKLMSFYIYIHFKFRYFYCKLYNPKIALYDRERKSYWKHFNHFARCYFWDKPGWMVHIWKPLNCLTIVETGREVGGEFINLPSIIQAVGLVLTVKGLRVEFSPQGCGLGLVSISSPLLFQTN